MNGKEGEPCNGTDHLYINMEAPPRRRSAGVPTCKVCDESEELIGQSICNCRGTDANICFECLRSIVQMRATTKHHIDFADEPVCPDYYLSLNGWTVSKILESLIIPVLYMIIFSFDLFGSKKLIQWIHKRAQKDYPKHNPIDYFPIISKVGSVGIFIGWYAIIGYGFVKLRREYRNLPKTIIVDVFDVRQERGRN